MVYRRYRHYRSRPSLRDPHGMLPSVLFSVYTILCSNKKHFRDNLDMSPSTMVYVAAKATYIRLLHGKIGILEGFFGPSSVHRGRTHIHRVRKKRVWSISGITSSNTSRFLNFFHCYNPQETCNKAIVKYPTTPQTRHYTTLWNIDVRKLACPVRCGSLTER